MPGGMIILGHNGQVARALAEAARGAGHPVTQLGRAELDLSQPDIIAAGLEPILAGAAAGTIVINTAAYTDVNRAEAEPEQARAINAIAPGIIARRCAEASLPLIHLSTDYVYDGAAVHAYTERDPCQPINAYGRSKLEGDRAVLDAGGRSLILRTSAVFSANGRNFLLTMLDLARRQDRIRVVNDQVSCPTSADDIALALTHLAQTFVKDDLPGGVFNFCGDTPRSWAEFAADIIDAFNHQSGRTVEIDPIPSSGYPSPAARPACSVLDCSAIRETFGIEQPDYRRALARVMSRMPG